MLQRIVLGAVVALLGVLVVLPLGSLALRATAAEGLTGVLQPAINTGVLAIGVTLFTAVVGIPLGFLLGRSDLPARSALRAVCTTPYVIPPYIAAIAWITLLNPTNGLVNQALGSIGLPILDVYSLPGMIWVMGLAFTPFMLLATADSLARMDASLEEQARIAGASPLRTLLTVTLPLAAPGIATGASFVMAAATASFGVPYLLGSTASTPTWVLTTRIQQELDARHADGYPTAALMALVLLTLGVGLPALARLLQGRRRFTTVTGKATRAAPFTLGAAKVPALLFVASYALLAVVLPVATIAATSVMRNIGRGLSPDNLTFGNYPAVLLERGGTLQALGHSLWLGALAATAAVIVGGLVAWMARRTTTPGRNGVAWLARLPYAVPGTVLALALILAFSQELRIIVFERLTLAVALSDTLWILGLAYFVKFLTFPVGNADAGLQALDPALEEAARLSGAGWGRTMKHVTLPLLAPNLIAAWFLVFMPAFSEVTMSILLAGPDTRVVGTLLFELQTYGDPPGAAVLAMIVLVLVLGGNTALRVVSRGKMGL
jgi:iron(III) transport system permease protein